METKHTPGPWILGTEGDGAVGSVYCDNALGSRVAIVYGREQAYTVFPREEEEANARLIAAAPNLLAACIAWRNSTNDEEEFAALNACEDAIAKAITPAAQESEP